MGTNWKVRENTVASGGHTLFSQKFVQAHVGWVASDSATEIENS